jgi:glycosyltransferase domain-containing protein
MQDKYYPLLEELTLVIPTYNRQPYAERCMNYWSDKGIKLIVIDGSETKIDTKNLKKFGKNIKYIHQPTDYYARLYSVIDMVKTEYVLMGCDDEFYIPSTLNSCIKTLKNESQLVACNGYVIGFNFVNNKVLGNDIYPRINKDKNLNEKNPNDRIKKHFSDYEQLFIYSVCKSNFWKLSAKTVFSKEYSCYSLHEIQIELLMCFAGKNKVIPELMWLRSNENHPYRNTSPSVSYSNTMQNWWYLKKFKNEKVNFLKKINTTCLKINDINKNNQIADIEGAIQSYLSFLKIRKKSYLYQGIGFFIKKLPNKIKNKIKILEKYLKNKINNQLTLIGCAKSFQSKNINIDFEELIKIEKNIINFHKSQNF